MTHFPAVSASRLTSAAPYGRGISTASGSSMTSSIRPAVDELSDLDSGVERLPLSTYLGIGGAAFVVLLVCVIVVTCCAVKKAREKSIQQRRDDEANSTLAELKREHDARTQQQWDKDMNTAIQKTRADGTYPRLVATLRSLYQERDQNPMSPEYLDLFKRVLVIDQHERGGLSARETQLMSQDSI